MNITKLSQAFKKFFNENGNFPSNYNDVLSTTRVLDREPKVGDYKYIAFICPSLKGFYNWHTHVKVGIKATVVKVGPSLIQGNENLERIDELVLFFYDNEVDVTVIDGKNSTYYAEKCIEFVQQQLIAEGKTELLKYIYPTESNSSFNSNESDDLSEECSDSDDTQWVYIFRHPKILNELKIGMTVRHWEERYAEANTNTYTSRDLEVVAVFPCKDCRAVERLIHSQFEQYRLPPKKGMKRSPEWFEFPENRVGEVVEKISSFMKSIELLTI